METHNFYSNGKLLITGEYLVLDGAKSLALPTKKGQSLSVAISEIGKNLLTWISLDVHSKIWFTCSFSLPDLKLIKTTDTVISNTLYKIFLEIRKTNPNFLSSEQGITAKTNLTFETNWGLGSSSTLINNIASWAEVDPFALQFTIFGGSAYDIACAKNNKPIVYQLNNKEPIIKEVVFNPPFKEQLFFVHLNKKQNSRDAIKSYRKTTLDKKAAIIAITEITKQLLATKLISEFEILLKNHEEIIASIIGLQPIQKTLFPDYFGQIKSLGAWGGDFILATGNAATKTYFNKKGYHTILTFEEMILS